jgi:hypothetical protein
MSIQDAIRAAEDNVQNHVSAERDPVMYNVSVALLNIARALQRLQNDVDGIERRQKKIESAVDYLPTQLRR